MHPSNGAGAAEALRQSGCRSSAFSIRSRNHQHPNVAYAHNHNRDIGRCGFQVQRSVGEPSAASDVDKRDTNQTATNGGEIPRFGGINPHARRPRYWPPNPSIFTPSLDEIGASFHQRWPKLVHARWPPVSRQRRTAALSRRTMAALAAKPYEVILFIPRLLGRMGDSDLELTFRVFPQPNVLPVGRQFAIDDLRQRAPGEGVR
jgi:hypothetical protein